jgi:hypothetical protein
VSLDLMLPAGLVLLPFFATILLSLAHLVPISHAASHLQAIRLRKAASGMSPAASTRPSQVGILETLHSWSVQLGWGCVTVVDNVDFFDINAAHSDRL